MKKSDFVKKTVLEFTPASTAAFFEGLMHHLLDIRPVKTRSILEEIRDQHVEASFASAIIDNHFACDGVFEHYDDGVDSAWIIEKSYDIFEHYLEDAKFGFDKQIKALFPELDGNFEVDFDPFEVSFKKFSSYIPDIFDRLLG